MDVSALSFSEVLLVDLQGLVDSGISKPARYFGKELGVEPRDWETASVRSTLTNPEI